MASVWKAVTSALSSSSDEPGEKDPLETLFSTDEDYQVPDERHKTPTIICLPFQHTIDGKIDDYAGQPGFDAERMYKLPRVTFDVLKRVLFTSVMEKKKTLMKRILSEMELEESEKREKSEKTPDLFETQWNEIDPSLLSEDFKKEVIREMVDHIEKVVFLEIGGNNCRSLKEFLLNPDLYCMVSLDWVFTFVMETIPFMGDLLVNQWPIVFGVPMVSDPSLSSVSPSEDGDQKLDADGDSEMSVEPQSGETSLIPDPSWLTPAKPILSSMPPNSDGRLDLTMGQCAFILACMFFCVYPRVNAASIIAGFGTSGQDSLSKLLSWCDYFNIVREQLMSEGILIGGQVTPPSVSASGDSASAAETTTDATMKKPLSESEWFNHRFITIHRAQQSKEELKQMVDELTKSDKKLRKVTAIHEGLIEESRTSLQADFANMYIGGGVLGGGNVQEEIRFTVDTECLVSCFVTPYAMRGNESILILGSQQYFDYTGYGSRFRITQRRPFRIDESDLAEPTPASSSSSSSSKAVSSAALPKLTDEMQDVLRYSRVISTSNFPFADENATPSDLSVLRRLNTGIVAIDALCRPGMAECGQLKMLREIIKCFVGFNAVARNDGDAFEFSSIATGNWGCGVFGGNKQLKSLLQLLSASLSNRDLVYYTFAKKETDGLLDHLEETIDALIEKDVSVGQLWQCLIQDKMEKEFRAAKNLRTRGPVPFKHVSQHFKLPEF